MWAQQANAIDFGHIFIVVQSASTCIWFLLWTNSIQLYLMFGKFPDCLHLNGNPLIIIYFLSLAVLWTSSVFNFHDTWVNSVKVTITFLGSFSPSFRFLTFYQKCVKACTVFWTKFRIKKCYKWCKKPIRALNFQNIDH